MELETLKALAQLGGTVVVVALFIWYLRDRNGKQERALGEVTGALGELHKSQEIHTRVLMRVAKNHGHHDDADDLMTQI